MKKKEQKSTEKEKQEQQAKADVQELKSDKSENDQVGSAPEQEATSQVEPAPASDTAAEISAKDAGGGVDTESSAKKVEDLQNKLDEANDKFLRLFSEFDNYRKRVARERIELTKTASESIISSLLPILDDLERAAEMAADKSASEADQQGIRLIYNKFKSLLRQKGVEDITAVGEDFNTDYHDAITHVPAKEKNQKGKIIEEVQKGYILNGKVIRYARVIVAN